MVCTPKGTFATYMVEIAMLEADFRCPAFRHIWEGQPIVIVFADGWNLDGRSKTKIELYQKIKASVLDTVTVGEFKSKFPTWRERFYDFCSNQKSKHAAWNLIERLIIPLERHWAVPPTQGVAAICAPVLPVDVVLIESPTSSDDDEPEVTGAVRGEAEEEKEKWIRWTLLMKSVQASVDHHRSEPQRRARLAERLS